MIDGEHTIYISSLLAITLYSGLGPHAPGFKVFHFGLKIADNRQKFSLRMFATRCLWSPVAVALGRRAFRSTAGLGVKHRAAAGRSGVLVGGAGGTPSPPALPATVSARGLPVFSVSTNLDAVPNGFIGGLSKVVAETLGKPEKVTRFS